MGFRVKFDIIKGIKPSTRELKPRKKPPTLGPGSDSKSAWAEARSEKESGTPP